jgi:hypothetical protein
VTEQLELWLYQFQAVHQLQQWDIAARIKYCHWFHLLWKNYFCQLLNVHGVNDVRQTKIHTAEPLVPKPSSSEVETAIEKLKRYK